MANAWYKKGRKQIGMGNIAWKASGGSDIRAVLVNTSLYTPNFDTHEFLSDASAGVFGTAVALALIDAADDGILDASDLSFTGLSSAPAIGALIIYKHTGVAGTSNLLMWLDQASGIPVGAGATQIDITFDNGTYKIARI